MPIAIATCWLSATARIAMPIRLFKKNQVKIARKTRLTPAPTSCTGGSITGPSSKGSSLTGMTMARVPAPNAITAVPRNTAASPIVAITTAITGRPISGRSRLVDIANREARLQQRFAPVFVGDLGAQIDFIGAAVKGVQHGGVLLGDKAAADLAGTGDLVVVGVEFLVQHQEAPDPRRF